MKIAIVAGSLLLASCQTAQKPEEEQVFGRVDCQRAEGRPDIAVHYEQASAICKNRAEAAAVAGTTAIPVGQGIGGAIASGIERGAAQNQIGAATAISCMAEQGYVRRTRSEHDRICTELKAHEVAKMSPRRR